MTRLGEQVGPRRPRRRGAAALRLHGTLAAGLALCVAGFVIETIRALDGNEFSWFYVFEWPLFAGFGIFMWWRLLHEVDDLAPPAPSIERRPEPLVDASGDEGERRRAPAVTEPVPADLLAWRRYLAQMEAAEEEPGDPTPPR